MIDFIKVGEKIANYRKSNNLTQDNLAEKLFVTRQLVSKWENGSGVPSIDVLLELSKLFGVSFEDILCLNEKTILDEKNIFNGRSRVFVIQGIVKNEIIVNLPDVFYQFSPVERMIVLKAIKEGSLKCNIGDLYPKLTPGEQVYLRKDYYNDIKKKNSWW